MREFGVANLYLEQNIDVPLLDINDQGLERANEEHYEGYGDREHGKGNKGLVKRLSLKCIK